jgi:hypothetical protein
MPLPLLTVRKPFNVRVQGMIINRGALLARLNEATVGLASKETVEQSNSFVFYDGVLMTFNDAIMVRVKSPLDFNVVVNAADLLGIVGKIPDEDVELKINEGELRVIGNRRKAGLVIAAEMLLPVADVPRADKWSRLVEGTTGSMQQAARVCNDDGSQYLTTCVHVGPDRVEGCDNFRVYRVDGPTGFPASVLLPASAVTELDGLDLTHVAVGQGWTHFQTASGAEISLRCDHGKYFADIDAVLELADAETIILPANLAEMVERAEVFHNGELDALIGIRIGGGELAITSMKDGGWYKERKKIRYDGRPLNFKINPAFLVEVLKKTRDVMVDNFKIKIASERFQFVVALQAKTDGDE